MHMYFILFTLTELLNKRHFRLNVQKGGKIQKIEKGQRIFSDTTPKYGIRGQEKKVQQLISVESDVYSEV